MPIKLPSADQLWGDSARFTPVLLAASLLLLTFLGSHALWTQENRWGSTVMEMVLRQDYFHPYVFGHAYYDKPLLSYWLILAVSKLLGGISSWSLRLPSVGAGLLSLYALYSLGSSLRDKRLGLLAAMMMLTTYYFVFWSRVASADILNLAGSLFAVSWYFKYREKPSLFSYTIFFVIIAVTSLCKGLVGAVVPVLALLPDLIHERRWRMHLRGSLLLGMSAGVALYFIPFLLSSYFGTGQYHDSGLHKVFAENIQRYFQPFDHKGPIVTYFIFLPVYLLPWTLFFFPALFSLRQRWKSMSWESKWCVLVTAIIFIFFTASGSRRNYYILPLIPYAILLTADWILVKGHSLRENMAARFASVFYLVLFALFCVLTPGYYSGGGSAVFAKEVRSQAVRQLPWSHWKMVLLGARPRELFYLQSHKLPTIYNPLPDHVELSPKTLLTHWPSLRHPAENAIFVTKKEYAGALSVLLKQYKMVLMPPILGDRLQKKSDMEAAVAFIPQGWAHAKTKSRRSISGAGSTRISGYTFQVS